jgi:hypothetical protein
MDAILAPFIATSAETCTQKSVPALYAQEVSSYGRHQPAPEPSPRKSLSEATSCACVMPYHRRGAACDTFAPRHIERSDAPKPTVRRGSWGKPSWSAVHPKSNDWDRALKRFIGCAPRRERKPFRPSGECAWCQAGYVNDRGHGRRLGLSAPRAFPSSALSGRRSCRWRWGGLEKRSQRRQSRPD